MTQATMAVCPKCGAKVRKEKLRRHLNTVHGDAPRPANPAPVAGTKASTVAFPWQLLLALGVAGSLVAAGYWAVSQPSAGPGPSTSRVAVLETNFGTIKIHLATDRAPRTAGNFIRLVESGDYDARSFHRVVANFVIQGGAVPGAANVTWENTGLTNVRYAVAMARSGEANDPNDRDSATSQFFISLKDNPSLDNYAYPYVVFGHVIEGQSVVDAIGALYPPGDPTYDGAPTSPVTITRAYMES